MVCLSTHQKSEQGIDSSLAYCMNYNIPVHVVKCQLRFSMGRVITRSSRYLVYKQSCPNTTINFMFSKDGL